jgi:argininosuccinate lyase
MKMWSGRFQSHTDRNMDDFHSSIHFDARLYAQDIKGSIAHVRMLGKTGVIENSEASLMEKALGEIRLDIENGKIAWETDAEDIHMNIEKILTERIGEVGKKLHTGRSRNDQVALDLRMYLKDEVKEMLSLLVSLENTLLNLAKDHTKTVMPGYTHLQRAQPITLAHHLMAYFEMFKRDIQRLMDTYKRINVMPLGAGALAGTTYPIDREMVAKELGFPEICQNTLDAVSDRDFVLELNFDLCMVMTHLSRFSEEVILWASSEFSFLELDDRFSTGSSIMPQKKNPDIPELVRGKSGRVFGHMMGLFTMLKGLPLAYNKDMQEDKEAIFDAVDTVKMCIPIFGKMLATSKFKTHTMRKATEEGFLNATDLADYLVKKGVAFRDAHEITGRIVAHGIEHKKQILEFNIEDLKRFSSLIEGDVFEEISIEKCVQKRNTPGGPSESMVLRSIAQGEAFLKKAKV